MSKRTVTLDVREDIRRGREPFGKIMQAVAALKENEDLLLIAPFEPKPLYGVLAQRGLSHQSTPTAEGEWEVRFTRASGAREWGQRNQGAGAQGASLPENPAPAVQHSDGSAQQPCTGTPVINLDARGLEPPEPLVKILEAVASLPAGARLRAHTDRRPMHLYAHLEERGFIGQTEEQTDGSFITHVSRR